MEELKKFVVRRQLTHTDAIVVLASIKGATENTKIVYQDIGRPTTENQIVYVDKISKVHDYLYAIDFIFPVTNLKLYFSVYPDPKENPIILDCKNDLIERVEFLIPIPIMSYSYSDFKLEYSLDKSQFALDLDICNLSKYTVPAYTVGLMHSRDHMSGFESINSEAHITVVSEDGKRTIRSEAININLKL